MARGKRKDFAVVYSRAFKDARVFSASANLPAEELRHLTVIGTIAAMSCFLIRDGESGILEGDGIGPTMMALGCGYGTAKTTVEALQKAGLLEAVDGGLYLKGFAEAYAVLFRERAKARENFAKGLAKVRGTFGESSPPTVAVAVEDLESKSESTSPRATHADPVAPPKRRDLRTPIEKRLLSEAGFSLGGRGGCGVSTWRSHLKAALAAGASEQEVFGLLATSSPLDKPWSVLRPLEQKYGRANGNGRAPRGGALSPELDAYLKTTERRDA